MTTTVHQFLTNPSAIYAMIDDIENEAHAIRVTCYVLRLSKHPSSHPLALAYQRMTAALLAAPGRGVACRLLACNPNATGALGRIDAASRSTIAAAGWQVRQTPATYLLHAKTYAFGAGAVWIGSHNMTATAWTNNCEVSTRNIDPHLTTEHHNFFAKNWQRATPL